jgi:hypothetical protein
VQTAVTDDRIHPRQAQACALTVSRNTLCVTAFGRAAGGMTAGIASRDWPGAQHDPTWVMVTPASRQGPGKVV